MEALKNLGGILCINLDHRTDRWSKCIDEFKKINIENIVQRYSAIPDYIGIRGCTQSHVNCIKIAKKEKYKNVLILEDDVCFKHDIFYEILNNVFNQLESKHLQYDMLYLGSKLTNLDNVLLDKNLVKIMGTKCAHAYIIQSNVYDYVIDTYEKINWWDNNLWCSNNPNRMKIDVWYNNIQKLGNVYGTYPAIASQYAGYSDIINMHIDYNLFEKYDNMIKTINKLTD